MEPLSPDQVVDAKDLRILAELQEDARLSMAVIGRRVGLSPAPCGRRVLAMERDGVILRYRAILDPVKLGLGVMAFVSVTLAKKTASYFKRFEDAISRHHEVIECVEISGRADYQLRVVATSIQEYREFLMRHLSAAPGVREVESTFVLGIVKSLAPLPLAQVTGASSSRRKGRSLRSPRGNTSRQRRTRAE